MLTSPPPPPSLHIIHICTKYTCLCVWGRGVYNLHFLLANEHLTLCSLTCRSNPRTSITIRPSSTHVMPYSSY